MSESLIEIAYRTEVLPLETVREKIFRRTRELKKAGYECHWTGDLDPKNPPRNTRGYNSLGDIITASFEKQDLQFIIGVSIEENAAWIYGESLVQESRSEEIQKTLENFEFLTGIHINLDHL